MQADNRTYFRFFFVQMDGGFFLTNRSFALLYSSLWAMNQSRSLLQLNCLRKSRISFITRVCKLISEPEWIYRRTLPQAGLEPVWPILSYHQSDKSGSAGSHIGYVPWQADRHLCQTMQKWVWSYTCILPVPFRLQTRPWLHRHHGYRPGHHRCSQHTRPARHDPVLCK